MKPIQMVDLIGQYQNIKTEVEEGIQEVLTTASFINGPQVKTFQRELEFYLGAKHVIPCANGTDALQIAMMALDLQPGDEVIVPAFTYVATAEVIGLLGLVPVMVDVDTSTYNVTASLIEEAITNKTKVIVPVHLFGQSCDMQPIMELAKKHDLFVIEDNAQAIGASYVDAFGCSQKTGTIGHIGCTSFYPSKNLGAYGDAGAIFTNDDDLAFKLRSIASHGQSKRRYYHDFIGVNSRLDSLQAVVLNAKLKRLDAYCEARVKVANYYDKAFSELDNVITPFRSGFSSHVFHQYVMVLKNGRAEDLQKRLKGKGVPSMVYYPVPLYKQGAYAHYWEEGKELSVTESLCKSVIALPMHTELDGEQLNYIAEIFKQEI